jgi:glycosyltransferase involved in cell wall biosynthesis
MKAMTKNNLFQLYKRFYAVDTPILFNVNRVTEANYNKRALLIYLAKPFLIKDDDPLFLLHQNLRRCKHIAAVLDGFGYIVDVTDRGNPSIEAAQDYDLVISDRADLQVANDHFGENAIKIFLATTDHHAVHNKSLQRRHALLHKRRNREVVIRREYPEALPFVIQSDAIIGVGNEFTMNTWKYSFEGPIYFFNNCGVKKARLPLAAKDFGRVRKNFLFFASRSQIQKGLDLLLEIFPKHPDLHLYVCSPFEFEEDFCACYYKELFETANIHPTGWVEVGSPEFYELTDNTAYIIHPTCSEGQPGAVIQCMYSGLIPIVTKEAGIDTEDFGITFSDDSLEEIEKVIVEVSRQPESWHLEQSIKTRKVAEEKYSESALINRWRDILGEILTTKNSAYRRKNMIEPCV